MPVPLFHNAWSQRNWGASSLLQQFWKDRSEDHSLTCLLCFDHAVVVQKSPGRVLCVVGRDHSHQEADQVISIISLIPHSGTVRFHGEKQKQNDVAFQGLNPFENQHNCKVSTVYCFVFLLFGVEE